MPTYPPEFIDWLTQRIQLARESADNLFKLPGSRYAALEQEAKASAYSDVLEYIEANISGASQKASAPKKAWKPTDKQLRLLHSIVNARQYSRGRSYFELEAGERRVLEHLRDKKLVTTINIEGKVVLTLTDAGYELIGETNPDKE